MQSGKVKDWLDYSDEVVKHIDNYVIPQYGDKGQDECEDYTAEDCVKQIKKYAARNGKNSRDGQDLLDLIKIGHYAQMAWSKLNAEKQ